ncbi:MAG: hypothetical protein ACI81P_000879 [Neolewinella sp.]|jgi:hypothetical protein
MLAALFTGCFAPINSTFESAKLLDKGGIEVQGSYSKYYGASFDDEDSNTNNNVGFAVGYGVSDKFNVKLRYERINVTSSEGLFDIETDAYGLNYFELSNKFSLKQDKIAVSIPLGVYIYEGEAAYSLDPRLFFTFGKSQTFEFNVVPKMHLVFGDEFEATPGINLGFGISKNLKEWAIRPEIGFDGYGTIGIGLNYYFQPKIGKE